MRRVVITGVGPISGSEYSADNPQERVGVSFGTALGGVSNAEVQHKAFVNNGPKSVHQMLALQVFGGSAHCNVAIEFGLRGGTTNSNSCASGNVAIGEALRCIREDWALPILFPSHELFQKISCY